MNWIEILLSVVVVFGLIAHFLERWALSTTLDSIKLERPRTDWVIPSSAICKEIRSGPPPCPVCKSSAVRSLVLGTVFCLNCNRVRNC